MIKSCCLINQGEISIENIRKQWNYLMKEYRKQHAQLWKYLRSGIRLEEATAIIGKPLWKHYLALTFVDPTDIRETESNVSKVNEDYSSGVSSASPNSRRKQHAQLWKYLRSGIRLEEATAIIGKPLWKHYLALTFVDPTDIRETESNVSKVNEDYSSGVSSASPNSRRY
ncbi:hypothetical protein FQA39_LY06280 [Lamprigera yunnana]|nr:hypothetical protein FQA39_LY06280 [Lamprigera yunnana]